MNLKFAIITFSLLFFSSCSVEKEEVEIPDNVLPLTKMTEVLKDIHLTQSHIDNERLHNPYIMDSVSDYYQSVYSKHNISKQVYDSSVRFYSLNVILMDSIYNTIFTDLKLEELALKDVKYNTPNVTYLSRETLIKQLDQLELSNYLVVDSINFVMARDSLFRYVKSQKEEFESLNFNPSQIKNSFGIYANSDKRFKAFQIDLKTHSNR